MSFLDEVPWDQHGLIAAVTQDAGTGRVLTVAWMNREALEQSVQRGEAVYWSRSRSALWRKGETSGHVQRVREIRLDCDGDTVLLQVDSVGGVACHTGRRRCFFNRLDTAGGTRRWTETDPVIEEPHG